MMWWLMWCAVVLVCRTAAAPASDNLQLQTLDLAQLDPPAPDDENLGYGYTSLGGRYSAGSPWFYLLSGVPRDSQINTENSDILRRSGRSLTVNPAFELLQRNAENAFWGRVVNNNRDYLDKVGKRDFPTKTNGDENGLVEDAEESRNRPKRKMPSLSINNPMEVLRQRLLLEVARKQMREASQRQAFANRLFLQNVGKRGYWAKSALSRTRYDN